MNFGSAQEYISIDATFKVCLKIMGQASYRASKAERDAAPFPDDDALRRVPIVLTRNYAVGQRFLVFDSGFSILQGGYCGLL